MIVWTVALRLASYKPETVECEMCRTSEPWPVDAPVASAGICGSWRLRKHGPLPWAGYKLTDQRGVSRAPAWRFRAGAGFNCGL